MSGIRPINLQPIRKEYLWGTEDWLLSYLHEGYEQVPLLIKKITANEALSIQVHPDDVYARVNENGCGKTEMWYVLDCEPGAFLYYGLKHRITKNEFLKRIQNGTITEVCRKVPVKKGDVYYIPAGLVHAIGKGISVLEIQQSSNITYRVFDYEREDANHNKRELHIDKAAAVAGFLPPLQGHCPMGNRIKTEQYERMLLARCEFFSVEHFLIKTKYCGVGKGKFMYLYVVSGNGTLVTENDKLCLCPEKGYYVPETVRDFVIEGQLEVIMSEVPE